MKATIWIGDALDAIDELDDDLVDSIVTDPPAGIGFQGHQWDSARGGRDRWIEWLTSILRGARRVLKPGGHLLLWALPRTSHWSATAVEEAGFEIRDVVTHLQAQGFPKSIGLAPGVGSALKPAAEHWILARRAPTGTLKSNFAKSGVGGLNIDESRVAGRWPANFIASHSDQCDELQCSDDCPVDELNRQAGTRTSGGRKAGFRKSIGYMGGAKGNPVGAVDGSSGPASRFFPVFFTPKATRSEREEGCDELQPRRADELTGRKEGSPGLINPRAGTNRTANGVKNYHPTVKSVALMSYLVKLVTPPAGVVLDPFTGSGSTGVAAVLSGRSFVGVEADEGFAMIARARVNYALLRMGQEAKPPR